MPDFEFDIFISYAHADNAPVAEEDGWVAQLHEGIKNWAVKITGKRPIIWRDLELKGIDYFDERLDENLEKAALLVAVMSPPYMESEWCQRELNQFLATAREQGRLRIGDKARVVKVIKKPIPRDTHPPELKNVMGYQFYQVIDKATGKTRELNKIFGEDDARQFNATLYDLVYEIGDVLKLIHEQRGETPTSAPAPSASSGKTIYLAVTTDDLNPQRDQIRRELEQHGHTVLPEGTLSWRNEELESQVRTFLERCSLSIHPVGEHYSFVPEAAERSVIEVQIVLAGERSQDPGFEHVIWMPKDLKPFEKKQQAVVQKLRENPAEAHLLETTLEDLKTFIQDRLTPKTPALTPETIQGDRQPYLYLLFHPLDKKDIEPLDDYFFQQEKYEVKKARFEDDGTFKQPRHQTILSACDTILVYYGQAPFEWVERTLSDLTTTVSDWNDKTTGVYVAGPEDDDKEDFRTHTVDEVIKHYGDFEAEKMAPLVRRINAKRRGAS